MQWDPATSFHLQDSSDRLLGEVFIEQVEGPLVLGKFTPGPDYATVVHLFHEFEEMVNQQVFSVVDELGATIDSVQLRLTSPDDPRGLELYDVQIMNEQDFSCRFKTTRTERNGTAGESQREVARSREPIPGSGKGTI